MDLTYIFQAGRRAVAPQVNKNFDDCKVAVDALEADVSEIQSELDSNPFVKTDGSAPFTNVQAYPKMTISNATNATPIVITATAHGRSTGDKVFIESVGGNTAANESWTITKITDNTFSLDGSVGNGSYTSGGTAYLLPKSNEDLANKAYADNKAGVKIGTCSTASATAEKAVVCAGFELVAGATIQITFSNANTATTPTININSKGALSPKNMRGDALKYIPANIPLDFRYDGTNLIGLYTNTFGVMPDYSNPISKNKDITYQAECDGFLYIYTYVQYGYNSRLHYSFNSDMSSSKNVFYNTVDSSGKNGIGGTFEIPKGMYYKGENSDPSGVLTLTFYPAKGAS